MGVREFVLGHWAVLAIAVVVATVTSAVRLMLQTMPPRSIAMATGPEGGAYHAIGKRYQAILAREGVQLRLVSTSGALQNLALLRDPRSGVSVAFLQGGITSEADASEIESLGTVFYEPLWLFRRSELKTPGLEGLRGRKVSVGVEGGGSRALSLELLKRSGIDGNNVELLEYSPEDASDKLLAGEIDAALMVISWDSPVVRQLLADERVELLIIRQPPAHLGNPLTAYAHLTRAVARIGQCQHEKLTAFAARAFRTIFRVADGAFQQRAPQQLASDRQVADPPLA